MPTNFLLLSFTFLLSSFTPGVAFAAAPWVFSPSAGSPVDIILSAALAGGTFTVVSFAVVGVYWLALKAFK
jgi:hypothetical protein